MGGWSTKSTVDQEREMESTIDDFSESEQWFLAMGWRLRRSRSRTGELWLCCIPNFLRSVGGTKDHLSGSSSFLMLKPSTLCCHIANVQFGLQDQDVRPRSQLRIRIQVYFTADRGEAPVLGCIDQRSGAARGQKKPFQIP
jgi:hypothetical protein